MKYAFYIRRCLTTFSLIGTTALLVACGGGGGGDAGTSTGGSNNQPPAIISSSSVSSANSSIVSVSSSSVSSIASSAASSLQAKPSSPNSLQATRISATQVTLAWQNPVTYAAQYRLVRNGQIISTIEGNHTSYTDNGLAPENQYTYRVQSSDSEGNWSPLSTGLSVRTAPVVTEEELPYGNSSSVSNWPPSSTPSYSSASSYSSISSYSSASSYSSVSSSQASSSSTADVIAPGTPSGVTTTSIKDTSIDLSWEAAFDNIGVTLYRISRDGEVVANVSGSSRNYLDLDLQPDTTYTYTIQAGDAAGNWSAASAPLTAKTTAAATEGGVLSWSHPTERENGEYLELDEIGGYELRYRENSLTPFTTIVIEGSYTTTFNLDDLRSSFDYQIAVFDTQGLYSEFVDIAPE